MAEFAKTTHANLPGLRHQASNIVVEGHGDSATGSAFLVGYRVDGGYQVIVTGRYADRLIRTDEGWRFTQRIFTPDR